MSTIHWTADQKKIIEKRGTDILVSAAAGSGKTAVLVERIFQRIIDEKKPVDIDRFVVVTFTRAAAAQMKDRLRSRIEAALEKDPENRHLQRQIPLLSSAHISTVHSFCGYVIKNYFHRIGLDPSYRQGTESELGLVRKEILEELLEREYKELREDFVALAERNSFNRSDAGIEEMILQVYNQAMSEPFPMEWLDKMEKFFSVESEEEWKKTEIYELLMTDMRRVVSSIGRQLTELIKVCEEPDGPYPYIENLQMVLDRVKKIESQTDFDKTAELFSELDFPRLSSKKDAAINPDKREFVKKERDNCKKALYDFRDKFFVRSAKENLDDLHGMERTVSPVLRLTREFTELFTEEKRRRNIVDFNDLEQLALSILLKKDKESGEYVRSEAARELAEYFEEIMIDEYQDSNRVQDTLLASVSRRGLEGFSSNVFMVGDVKQSIYRFRNACPELFAEKLDCYSLDTEGEESVNNQGCRIDLHQNFRSRELVLEGCNQVFERVMHRDIGGVEYDEAARLLTGREFLKTEKSVADTIDAYVILGNSDAEAEGKLAALKIKEMVKGDRPLFIQAKDEVRRVEYRDIVILARSTKSVGRIYFNMLTESGIPVVMEQSQGFFETREIQMMTQMLQVIDNPRDDISLAGVLCSIMFGWTEEELAKVRGKSADMDLYDSIRSWEGEDEKVEEKRERFFDVLKTLREKTSYAPVEELIQNIYDVTGIYDAVRMMRDGAQRVANMDYLMEQAREFDGSTYHGLHAFVRYIKRVREQNQDIGEVNIVGEEENVVRIMTMHKSKGLEFPVCLLLGMGRKLDSNFSAGLMIHQRYGIACSIEDKETRTVKKTLYQRILERQNKMEDLGEELRVLYVAMTRAQEKLILIGCGNKIEARPLNYSGRSGMHSFFDMVMPAALPETKWFRVIPVEREEILQQTASEMVDETIMTEVLNNFDTSVIYHKELHERLEELSTGAQKTHEPLPVKVSVSDLKVKSMEEQDFTDFTILSHEEDEEEMPVPAFAKKEEDIADARKGAAYGTIWHQVMATIDFTKAENEEQIRQSVDELVRTGRLREDETVVLNYKRLAAFFSSMLGREMILASREGRLHREQPFVIAKPARELFEGRTEEELVLVQGIIDGYYETEHGVVLLDYKTDSLRKGEEAILVQRYRTQMELYKEALEDMLELPVTKCVLYSFALGKEIEV